jgi:hypothetical protein
MSTVAVYSYTHSVTYVADNILKGLKDILVLSGLDPAKLMGDWTTLLTGISRWIETKHLVSVTLEIYDPSTDALITCWELSISYAWDLNAGEFWADTNQLRYNIKKAGLVPSQANYRVLVKTNEGRPAVDGWYAVQFRSKDGMVRQSLGKTVEHSGLGASASYWRRL